MEQSIKEFANIDHERTLRKGFPEVIYSASKTPEQVAMIALKILEKNNVFLATKAEQEHFEALRARCPDVCYNSIARCLYLDKREKQEKVGKIAIITAGTSDQAVAEEAYITADLMGSNVIKIFDVGVAGIHRLFNRKKDFEDANVIIVAAGMEGALPSVVSGLVDKVVIGVPTSVGYGASFGGVASLLGMLNSCATGVVTVNIDNGFGAGAAAHMINSFKKTW